MNGPQKVLLSKLGTLKKGGAILREKLRPEGEAVILYGDIYTKYSEIVTRMVSRVDPSAVVDGVRLNDGDIIFAGSGETAAEIGKCIAYVGNEEAYAGGDVVILSNHGQDARYLGYALNAEDAIRQKMRLGQGSSVMHLYKDDVGSIQIPLPSLAEQRKIAEILRTWDEAIETAEAEHKGKLERKRWLTGKFFSSSLMSVGVENAKNEWPKKLLGELTEVLDGKRKPISKEFRKPGPFPYFGACGVVDYVDSYLFDEPLVLVGEDGAKWGAGESTAFIVNEKCWVNNHAHVLRPNRDVIMDYWMMSWLNFRDLGEYVSGLTVPKLNQANLRAILIPVPPLVQQRKFVEILQASDVDIEALSNRIVSLRAQKRGLLQKLLTGEVRVAA